MALNKGSHGFPTPLYHGLAGRHQICGDREHSRKATLACACVCMCACVFALEHVCVRLVMATNQTAQLLMENNDTIVDSKPSRRVLNTVLLCSVITGMCAVKCVGLLQ